MKYGKNQRDKEDWIMNEFLIILAAPFVIFLILIVILVILDYLKLKKISKFISRIIDDVLHYPV